MKGPHAAALAVGWLAVALSMAALATAAISRVGTRTSGAQAQVTITMTATVRATPTVPSLALIPSATPSTAVSTIEIPAAAYETWVQTIQTARSSRVSRATIAPPIATAPAASTSAPVVWFPTIGTLPPSSPSASPDATSHKPTATRSTKTPTPSATTTTPLEANETISERSWTRRQGGIHAGCRDGRLAYAEPWAATGYEVVKSSTWIRTAILFKGAAPLTVMVGCHDGSPTFSTSS